MNRPPPEPVVMLDPVVTVREHLPDTCLAVELFLDPKLACFQGHFPEIAILPGVMQLDWAFRLGVQRFAVKSALASVKNLRFRQALFAGDLVILKVEKRSDKHFTFEFLRADKTCSSGELLLK